MLFVDGQREAALEGDDLAKQFISRIEKYVRLKYS